MLAKQICLQDCLAGNRKDQQDLVTLLDAQNFRPVIDRSFSLEKLADAFAFQAKGRHVGKIVTDI
ncbi:zinc-binding dehydrogenase [Burkholderia stagnalis]